MRRPALIGLLFLGLLPDVAAAQAGGLSDPLDPSSSPATGSTDTVEESDPAAAPDQESTAEVPPGEATATTEPADEADPTEAAPPGSSSEESEFESPATAPGAPRMRMLVVDVATFGIDPVVGQVASARMRRTGDELGYEVLTQAETIQAAQRLQMPYPPTPADLWRVSWIARAHRGAFARIWAQAGEYVVEVTVASLDGAGPFFARGTAGADDLRGVVDQLLRSVLPEPSVWNAEGAARAGTVARDEPPVADTPSDPTPTSADEGTSEADDAPPPPELRRWQLSVQTEGAIGAAEQVYYNHLVGLRLDFRITNTIALGAYVAYANLNARNGRADNMLLMLQFENRIRLSSDLDLTIPLRAAVGYLPFNGPVVRFSAGFNYAVDPHWEIGVDLLAPTFWILPGQTAISLNLALEGTYRF